MPKHKPLETTLGDCVNRISNRNGDSWYDVMCIEVPGLQSAIDAEDFDTAHKIEAEYIKQHENDPITVVWPEHVLTPRFNSDASYQ